MVYWKWHPTVLKKKNTGHGMFSGTGFYTKEGKPAIIYHGQGSGRNWIQYALDETFDRWSELSGINFVFEPNDDGIAIIEAPTGVGKTEIARRLANLADAPFIKVEATKFTEVGYVGRDVEQIVRDLVDAAIAMTREHMREDVKANAHKAAEDRVIEGPEPAPEREEIEHGADDQDPGCRWPNGGTRHL